MLYPADSFTHVLCLYFTIYYIKNKKQFLTNCYDWLKPGGYLVLHLVNRNKFDPILNSADPLQAVSAQKYAKKRITNSLIKFKDFQYRGDFKLDKDIATFEEIFKDDKTKHIRRIYIKCICPHNDIFYLLPRVRVYFKRKNRLGACAIRISIFICFIQT